MSAPDAYAVRAAIIASPWRPATKCVAVLIFDEQQLGRGWCRLGVRELAEWLAMDVRSVRRALVEIGDALDTRDRGPGRKRWRRLHTDRAPISSPPSRRGKGAPPGGDRLAVSLATAARGAR